MGVDRDLGRGMGAFSPRLTDQGYDALGLTWDAAQRERAETRARRLGASAHFRALDVRDLDRAEDLRNQFAVVVLCEVIEHVLDDRRLLRAAAGCLEPGGRILLTTPNLQYRAVVPEHAGPFSSLENGEHVRRGYTKSHLVELCQQAGLIPEEITSCSGLLSQKATWACYTAGRLSPHLARALTLPLHPIVSALDRTVTSWTDWPPYSLCVEGVKPRFAKQL